jgi:hypothetical protein
MHAEGTHFHFELYRLAGLNLIVGRARDIECVGPGVWAPWTQIQSVRGTPTGNDLFALDGCGIGNAGRAIKLRICFHNDPVSVRNSKEEKHRKNPSPASLCGIKEQDCYKESAADEDI